MHKQVSHYEGKYFVTRAQEKRQPPTAPEPTLKGIAKNIASTSLRVFPPLLLMHGHVIKITAHTICIMPPKGHLVIVLPLSDLIAIVCSADLRYSFRMLCQSAPIRNRQ